MWYCIYHCPLVLLYYLIDLCCGGWEESCGIVFITVLLFCTIRSTGSESGTDAAAVVSSGMEICSATTRLPYYPPGTSPEELAAADARDAAAKAHTTVAGRPGATSASVVTDGPSPCGLAPRPRAAPILPPGLATSSRAAPTLPPGLPTPSRAAPTPPLASSPSPVVAPTAARVVVPVAAPAGVDNDESRARDLELLYSTRR